MRRRSRELWIALVCILLVAAGYAFLYWYNVDLLKSGNLVGHLFGIVGFVLMLMTEVLYTLRKRNRRASQWGKADSWLQFHVITGIVGPFMVVLHAFGNFNGLAGGVTALMLLIVISGFVGRYIYTMLPRTTSGSEIEGKELEQYVLSTEAEISNWLHRYPELKQRLPKDLTTLPPLNPNRWDLLVKRLPREWRFAWHWQRETRGLDKEKLKPLKQLLKQRRVMNYQLSGQLMIRRVLALWHTFHHTLGIALFLTALLHILVAVYYGMLSQ